MHIVHKKTTVAGMVLMGLLINTAVFAKNSFWGGEIQSDQDFGYGTYSVTMKPATYPGSITGFFNLCYANGNYSNCIKWSPQDAFHLENDMEFTPLGNNPAGHQWLTGSCLAGGSCAQTSGISPRDPQQDLQAVSFNSYPVNNQAYYKTPFDPYAGFHTYSITLLPNKIIWSVDGAPVLSRAPGQVGLRQFPPGFSNFNQLLENNKIAIHINVWDGSQGSDGGFGGPPNSGSTNGDPAQIKSVSFAPASCQGNNCIIGAATYSANFTSNCDNVLNNDWTKIERKQFPVYVHQANVQCNASNNLLQISATNS